MKKVVHIRLPTKYYSTDLLVNYSDYMFIVKQIRHGKSVRYIRSEFWWWTI